MTRNTVPPGSVVPTFLPEASKSPELSAGIVSVVQTTHADAPGRFDTMFFETSSIFTTARPLPSCPVTTRRTCTVMISSQRRSQFAPEELYGGASARPRYHLDAVASPARRHVPHSVTLITTIAAGLGLALIMGFIAVRLKLPALAQIGEFSFILAG